LRGEKQMAGRIKYMIDEIVKKRSKGNKSIEANIKIKMILKGVFPEKYDLESDDDKVVIDKLNAIATEFDVKFD
jgi:hypothetical protein